MLTDLANFIHSCCTLEFIAQSAGGEQIVIHCKGNSPQQTSSIHSHRGAKQPFSPSLSVVRRERQDGGVQGWEPASYERTASDGLWFTAASYCLKRSALYFNSRLCGQEQSSNSDPTVTPGSCSTGLRQGPMQQILWRWCDCKELSLDCILYSNLVSTFSLFFPLPYGHREYSRLFP